MSAPQHTPAPWRRRKGPFGSIVVGPAILEHPGRDSRYLAEKLAQREADAALIGAAPKMAGVLRDLIAAWDRFETDGPAPLDTIIEAARAAIAEAEGWS